MAKSMTAYGKGVFEQDGLKFTLELKAVNNKYCEINIRLPKLLNPLEERLRKALLSHISRGRVDVFIHFENYGQDAYKIKYNKALAQAYKAALDTLADDLGQSGKEFNFLPMVAKFHDVLEVDKTTEEGDLESIWQGLEQACNQAISSFIDMRKREGEYLKKDIMQRLGAILEVLKAIEEKTPDVINHYRAKLKQRIEDALEGIAIDEARLINEVAFFADKVDISEEITRLKSHIMQFEGILAGDEAFGRKLDFITQEMAREANTIGSKANFADISKMAIELKSEIEKIREQVQNIE
ncbi:MAG: YicC family protein [Defluviitaleaceae bacterium]|nr:YicC family protein [Defluviitaleaceae bacterium]